MIQEQLVDYISSQIKLGVSQDAIKATLTGAGWAIADVEDTFKKINGGGAAAKPTVSSPVETSFSAATISAKTPAKAPEGQTIRVSDLVSTSSASAVSTAASVAQPKISPLSQGAGKPTQTATAQPMAVTKTKTSGGKFPIMTVVWIVLVVIFAGLAGYFFYENMGLSSQIGNVNTQSQGVTSQVATLETQVKAFTASSTAMATQIASLTASNTQLETELSFFVAPPGGAIPTNFALSGTISGGKPTFTFMTSDGVKVSIKNSADAPVHSALQALASSSQPGQLTGTYIPGSLSVTVLTLNGTSLYPPPAPTSTTPSTTPMTTPGTSTTPTSTGAVKTQTPSTTPSSTPGQ